MGRVKALEASLAAEGVSDDPEQFRAEIDAYKTLILLDAPITYGEWLAKHPEHEPVGREVFSLMHDNNPAEYLWSEPDE